MTKTQDHWTLKELRKASQRLQDLGLVQLTVQRACGVCGKLMRFSAGMGPRGGVCHMDCLLKEFGQVPS